MKVGALLKQLSCSAFTLLFIYSTVVEQVWARAQKNHCEQALNGRASLEKHSQSATPTGGMRSVVEELDDSLMFGELHSTPDISEFRNDFYQFRDALRSIADKYPDRDVYSVDYFKTLAATPLTRNIDVFNLPGMRVRQMAAIMLGRQLGLATPGEPYSEERMRQEAAFLGQDVRVFPELYRMDKRPPAEIKGQGGFRPNPNKISTVLWQHVARDFNSGSYISTTLSIGNPQVVALIARPVVIKGMPEERIEIYEYKMQNVTGMRTPDEFGAPSEQEVVTNVVPNSEIVSYRKFVISKWTGEMLETSNWQMF